MTNPIERIRKEMGITRADLALAIGVSYAQIHAIETGHPEALSQGFRDKLAAVVPDEEKRDALAILYAGWRTERAQEIRIQAAKAVGRE